MTSKLEAAEICSLQNIKTMLQHYKQILINLLIAGSFQVVYFIFSNQKPLDQHWEIDYFKGGFLLLVLIIGLVGAIGEAKELRQYGYSGGWWFFLSFLAVAGHILVYASALNYLGKDSLTGNPENPGFWFMFGCIFFTFFFLFELIYAYTGEEKSDKEYTRVFGWSDILLAIYAAMGSAYVWDVLMANMTYKFDNWPYFIFAELFPSILVFILIILPFKRYFIVERKLLVKNRKQEWLFYGSYLLVILSAILPRVVSVLKEHLII